MEFYTESIGFTNFEYEVKEGSKSEIFGRGASNENDHTGASTLQPIAAKYTHNK